MWGVSLTNKKSLFFVVSHPFSEPVVRNRLTPFLERGSELGYQVIVCLPKTSKALPNIKGVTFLQAECIKVKSRNFIRRALEEVFLTFKVLNKLPRKFDYVVVTIPSIFLFIFLRRYKGAKKILDVRDLTWEYLEERILLQRIFKIIFRCILRKKINDFDLILCTNRDEKIYLDKYLEIKKPAIVISNGVSKAQFRDLSSVPNASASKKEKIVISYIGTVGLAQNLAILLSVAKSTPNYHFNILGEGKDFARIKGLSQSVNNLAVLGRVSWDNVLRIYRETDILYAQLSKSYESAVPSKLYEYLATGKPIVYGGSGEAKEVLSKFDDVYVIPPDSPIELKRVLEQVASNLKPNRVLKENIERIKQGFIREDYVNIFFEKLQNIPEKESKF